MSGKAHHLAGTSASPIIGPVPVEVPLILDHASVFIHGRAVKGNHDGCIALGHIRSRRNVNRPLVDDIKGHRGRVRQAVIIGDPERGRIGPRRGEGVKHVPLSGGRPIIGVVSVKVPLVEYNHSVRVGRPAGEDHVLLEIGPSGLRLFNHGLGLGAGYDFHAAGCCQAAVIRDHQHGMVCTGLIIGMGGGGLFAVHLAHDPLEPYIIDVPSIREIGVARSQTKSNPYIGVSRIIAQVHLCAGPLILGSSAERGDLVPGVATVRGDLHPSVGVPVEYITMPKGQDNGLACSEIKGAAGQAGIRIGGIIALRAVGPAGNTAVSILVGNRPGLVRGPNARAGLHIVFERAVEIPFVFYDRAVRIR